MPGDLPDAVVLDRAIGLGDCPRARGGLWRSGIAVLDPIARLGPLRRGARPRGRQPRVLERDHALAPDEGPAETPRRKVRPAGGGRRQPPGCGFVESPAPSRCARPRCSGRSRTWGPVLAPPSTGRAPATEVAAVAKARGRWPTPPAVTRPPTVPPPVSGRFTRPTGRRPSRRPRAAAAGLERRRCTSRTVSAAVARSDRSAASISPRSQGRPSPRPTSITPSETISRRTPDSSEVVLDGLGLAGLRGRGPGTRTRSTPRRRAGSRGHVAAVGDRHLRMCRVPTRGEGGHLGARSGHLAEGLVHHDREPR